MALYTGIMAIKKIKGIDNELLREVPFYEEYKSFLDYNESFGVILEELEDKNYNNFYPKYAEKITHMDNIVNLIDKYDLKNKYEAIKIMFITKEYDLAKNLGIYLKSETFYFRKIVEANNLVEILSKFDIKTYNFSNASKEIQEFKDDYFFEVFVS